MKANQCLPGARGGERVITPTWGHKVTFGGDEYICHNFFFLFRATPMAYGNSWAGVESEP